VTGFIAIAAVLAAAAVALLAWPLLRTRRADGGEQPRAAMTAMIVATLMPAAAFVLYFVASNWRWDAPSQSAELTAGDLRRVTVQLRERLASQPDDIEGWKLLGRSATVLGDFPAAREAFGEAYARTQGRDAEAVVGYAESLVLNDEREIDGEAARLFEQALEMAPDNPRALWYGGIVAYRRGELALAQQRWVELQNRGELTPDLRQMLAERLAELGRPETAAAAAAPAKPPVTQSGSIALSIDIAPALAGKASAGTTLFVIARRGTGGPPLAVVRRSVDSWPLTLRMSDADAMLPGTRLADGGPVTLVARISRSGTPTAASGDLFGEVRYDFTSADPARLTIDRIVP
jgi:cytochrome c-type biogenesis protein CcmH